MRIPTPLRRYTRNASEVQVEARTLGEALEQLEQRYPGIRERLVDENGQLRRFVNIFVNDEDVRYLQELDTPLKEGDEISIVPSIAGGRR